MPGERILYLIGVAIGLGCVAVGTVILASGGPVAAGLLPFAFAGMVAVQLLADRRRVWSPPTTPTPGWFCATRGFHVATATGVGTNEFISATHCSICGCELSPSPSR